MREVIAVLTLTKHIRVDFVQEGSAAGEQDKCAAAADLRVPLILQGWRLDPLLLFGQLLTAGTATAFAVESLRLRDIISEEVRPRKHRL